MKILLTGGSGDLGKSVGPALEGLGHTVTNLDLKPADKPYGSFAQGSILDRELLSHVLPGTDCVVHIAAFHGIHEFRKSVSADQFWDINVTGTFNVLEAARQAQVSRFVFISSTSVDNADSFYGHTKLLAEETCKSYATMDPAMSIISLRPRAFIPHWNKDVYDSFVDWAKWYWRGAVHIQDVSQAVMRSIDLLTTTKLTSCPTLVIDGKYDYTPEDLQAWDKDGPGTTFKKLYGQANYELAVEKGLDPSLKPKVLDISETTKQLGYAPTYSLRNLLEELALVK